MKITIIVSLILFISCQQTTEPPVAIHQIPYMTFEVGDVRQYYSEQDNAYLEWEVKDTTSRIDGTNVFSVLETSYLGNFTFSGTNYYFIRDGFLIRTQNDTIATQRNDSENPFSEEKLCKIYPINGDLFLQNVGAVDSEKVYVKIEILDSLITDLGTFKNIARYEEFNSDSLVGIKIYYAPEIGHLGALYFNKIRSSWFSAIYIKVGNIELGKRKYFNNKLNNKIKSYRLSIY